MDGSEDDVLFQDVCSGNDDIADPVNEDSSDSDDDDDDYYDAPPEITEPELRTLFEESDGEEFDGF